MTKSEAEVVQAAGDNLHKENNIPEEETYSRFTIWEKRYIVLLVAFAGWFSTLSSFIFYPAIDQMAQNLNVSVSRINLAVTSYMAVATVAPALVGDAADILGRRGVYLLVLAVYLAANISIATSSTFAELLGLRMLQAASISGSFSIAYGVVADIAHVSDRGSYVSALSLGITTAPSIGPILGGALAYVGGWRWIFWFLSIASGVCLLAMALSLPETARNIVGNGSNPPPTILKLPYKAFMTHWDSNASVLDHKYRIPNPLKSLVVLLRKDNFIVILAISLLYMVYCCIHTSLSTQFIDIYGLNQWQAGLIYLPFGIGGTVASFLSGRIMDKSYKQIAIARGLSTEKVKGDDLDKFPIEVARLRCIWIPNVVAGSSVLAFGWTLRKGISMAAPLSMQFVVGMSMQTCFNISNTLLVDINQKCPSAAQASSNIIRCAFAAVAVSFLQQIINDIGCGWTYTILAFSCFLSIGLFLLDYLFGMHWRQNANIQPKANNPKT